MREESVRLHPKNHAGQDPKNSSPKEGKVASRPLHRGCQPAAPYDHRNERNTSSKGNLDEGARLQSMKKGEVQARELGDRP